VVQAAALGDCDRANVLFEQGRSAQSIPKSAEDPMLYILARCRMQAGDYTAAITALRTIVEREIYFGDAAPMIPVAWFYLGEAYERKGDVARAIAAYERVLELWKDGDDDLYCRREARIRLDRLAGSRSM